MVHTVTDKEDFAEQLKIAGNKLVVLDFSATWCGPCKMISPKVEELSKEFDNVLFLKIDVDDCEAIAIEYNISCMPTFLFLKNGERVDEFSGADAVMLRDLVTKHK